MAEILTNQNSVAPAAILIILLSVYGMFVGGVADVDTCGCDRIARTWSGKKCLENVMMHISSSIRFLDKLEKVVYLDWIVDNRSNAVDIA